MQCTCTRPACCLCQSLLNRWPRKPLKPSTAFSTFSTCGMASSPHKYDATTARYLARGALKVPAVPLCHPPPKTSQRQSCNTTAGLSTKRRATSFNLPQRSSITTSARIASLMSLGSRRGIWPLVYPWIACSDARPLVARRSVSSS
jgi:hypothetical protein